MKTLKRATPRWVVCRQPHEVRFHFSTKNRDPLPWRWDRYPEQVGDYPDTGESSFRFTAHVQAWFSWRRQARLRRRYYDAQQWAAEILEERDDRFGS